jgi:hypothetical protein
MRSSYYRTTRLLGVVAAFGAIAGLFSRNLDAIRASGHGRQPRAAAAALPTVVVADTDLYRAIHLGPVLVTVDQINGGQTPPSSPMGCTNQTAEQGSKGVQLTNHGWGVDVKSLLGQMDTVWRKVGPHILCPAALSSFSDVCVDRTTRVPT